MPDLLARLGASRPHAEAALAELEGADAARRLFAGDGGLWSDDAERAAEIGRWIGWLPVVEEMHGRARELTQWAAGARHGRERTVLCGMGGSSLAPLVFASAFGGPLEVLDTTDPDAVGAIPVDGSLFVVASKSGTTIEPLVMMETFLDATGQDGSRFVAITDPGSFLAGQAAELGFHTVFTNRPDIGGRYSALSLFGLVPAALAGVPIDALLASAVQARDASSPEVRGGGQPGAPARRRARRAGPRGARQADHPHVALAGPLRPLAGAAHRRVDGQGGHRRGAAGRRGAGRPRRLRRRSRLRPRARRRHARRDDRRAAGRRPSRRGARRRGRRRSSAGRC